MRPEHIFAISVVTAAVSFPVGLVVIGADVVPKIGTGTVETYEDRGPLTLITEPMMVPAYGDDGYRVVVAELDLPNRNSANNICRQQPRLASQVQLYLQGEDGPPATARSGHDARLRWALDQVLTDGNIERVALIEQKPLRRRAFHRTPYQCRGDVAWERGVQAGE